MRSLIALALMGCAPKQTMVKWATIAPTSTEQIELRSNGDGIYSSTVDGMRIKTQRVLLTHDQFAELAELFRTQQVCELAHDPSYTPAPEEGKTTLELAFPDQHCTVVMWNTEWQRGRAKEITETMHSMRPLRPQPPGRIEPP